MITCPACGEENPDRFRLCGFCGAPLAPVLPAREVRKTVTIVFSDLKGSTAMAEKLDSEAVREVMSRYFDEMKGALELHGGTIEKYIGDAIMAVFGLPRIHEDDALRAVRAAAEMKRRLAVLNEELERRWGITLANRTGVNTGEVVAGDPTTGQRLVTGDTVNVAARLEQAAPAQEVLLGELTHRLVRGAVEVEPVEPLELKGKSERVPAYRLLAVDEVGGPGRRHDLPLVGRERELELLGGEFDAAVAARRCRLVTIEAQAGVGKSRLIDEFGRSLADAATVLRGRCLPYGRGITFWPLAEAVREAASIEDDDSPEAARAKLADVAGDHDVAARVAAAIGLSEAEFALAELFWGARELLEAIARRRPLVVVFEDIHWAEEAFLDLLEHVLSTAEDAPLLLVCPTRPDLRERRPGWGGHDAAATVVLSPLSDEDTARVIEHLLGDAPIADDVRARIVRSAEGNPLFVEQLLSMLIDDGTLRRDGDAWVATGDVSEELTIPGSIEALLAARLDLLSDEQRAVVEPASVIGLIFQRPAVEELAPDAVKTEVEAHLLRLQDKQLVQHRELDLFRFQHILIRDAAYNGLLKRARATFHERFADWAERVNRDRDRETEYEEILGYHLEQAHRYLTELGPLDDHGLGIGRRGSTLLASAGNRAFARGDMGAAANLLRRAVHLLPEGERARLALLPDLAEALMETGEFAWAEVFLDEAVGAADRQGDERLRADAVLTRLLVAHHTAEDLDGWAADVQRETAALIPSLERMNAHAELVKAWRMIAFVHASACRWQETAEAQRQAIEHAGAGGLPRQESRMASAYTIALAEGPTPVPQALDECMAIREQGFDDRQAEAVVLCSLASLFALGGAFDEARDCYRRARALWNELGATVRAAMTSLTSGRVELLAGDPAAAERELRRDDETLAAMGERYLRPVVLAMLAQAILLQGRADEARALAEEARALAADDDVEAQALWRSVVARALAAEGQHDEALQLAREGMELALRTDAPFLQVGALSDFAEAAALAGDEDGAREALGQALDRCRLKEMPVPLGQVEAALARLDGTAALAHD